MAKLNKSFWEYRTLFSKRVLVICLFFITMHIQADGEYKLLSWSGDVRVMQEEKFLQLAKQSKILLRETDAVWIPDGASVELVFPDGSKKVFNGPRFNRVGTMQKVKTETRPSFLAIFFKNLDLGKYIARGRENPPGATKGEDFKHSVSFYEEIKKAIQEMGPEMKGTQLPVGKEEEIKTALSYVESDFDAAPPEVRILINAKVYKYFQQGRPALETAFNYYETILRVEDKQKERALLEEFVIDEVLPLVVTYEVEEPGMLYGGELDAARVSLRFVSNFKVWWAAFSFDGKEIKEIEKTIDSSLNPQETFLIRNHHMGNEKSKPYFLFIVVTPVWSQLEKYDDIEVAGKELRNEKIPETGFNKAGGFGEVIVKIDLNRVRRLMEEKMKRAAHLSLFFICLFFGICNL